MMKYIVLPREVGEPLPFYLAAEEYVAQHLDAESEYFFMWQVEPTVIFGRNQLIENEVNLDYCREHGIATYRRKSGGGCVYADRENIMFSYINSSLGVQFTFDRYLRMVAFLLQKLGLNATASGRNDILVDGRKVSGNAFYRVGKRNIVHGTMLYGTHLENMVGSITPSSEKLRSKGVQSVRSRILLLRDHIDLSLDEFKAFVRQGLCDGEVVLGDDAVAEIRMLARQYEADSFIYGNNPKYTLEYRQRVEGCGDLHLKLEMKNDVIRAVDMHGDFFLTGDLTALLSKLTGVKRHREALAKALRGEDVSRTVMNLTTGQLIDALLQDTDQTTT